MTFDLHFAETFRGIDVKPLTTKGAYFLNGETGDFEPDIDSFETTVIHAREICGEATEDNLKVSFDTAATRDLLAAVR
jgi:hypothetical protein